jgi:hypothetical protein
MTVMSEGEVTERQEKGGRTADASARVALLEPEGSNANAIVVENKFGSVVIDEPGYGNRLSSRALCMATLRRCSHKRF